MQHAMVTQCPWTLLLPTLSDLHGQDLNEWGSVGKLQSAPASSVSPVVRSNGRYFPWTLLLSSLTMNLYSHGKDNHGRGAVGA